MDNSPKPNSDTFIVRKGDGIFIEGGIKPFEVNGDAGGWKIHIPVSHEIKAGPIIGGEGHLNVEMAANSIADPNTRAIFRFVEQNADKILQAKVGGGGVAADGKGMTIYLGSRQNMESFVKKLELYVERNGISIGDPKGSVIGDDMLVGKSGKVMARWDTTLRKGILPYGHDGI